MFPHMCTIWLSCRHGTHLLDVCSPETPDAECGFTVVSLREDQEQVGELRRYRDADVRIRGIVQKMSGRSGMLLSHARQFHGGPPKFRPNTKLLHGSRENRPDRLLPIRT